MGSHALLFLFQHPDRTLDSRRVRHSLHQPVRRRSRCLWFTRLTISVGSLFATIFHNGQVIETFRGRGIYQPALSTAINKLDEGRWIHIFPEGKVNQPLEPPSSPTRDHDLLRFRWGVSRLIMEARREPWIVPMYLQGFDRLMPEDRPFPRFLPRLWPRKPVSITFGAPLRVDAQRVPELESYRSTLDRPSLGIPHLPGRFLPRPGHHPSDPGADTALARKCRIAVADWLREEVDRLGREVRGREGDGTRGGRREGFGGPGVETH